MRSCSTMILWALFAALMAAGAVRAESSPPLPVIDGKTTVATVNGEPITLDELFEQVGAFHAGMKDTGSQVKKPDPTAMLDRLINARLVLQEARNIGLDELPEVQAQMALYRKDLLRDFLVEEQVKDVGPPDPEKVKTLYRETVREFGVDSVLVETEEEAAQLAARARSTGELRAAEGREGERYLKASEMLPEVRSALEGMKPGQVSDPIRLAKGFAVVELLGVRYPEDPAVKASVEGQVLQAMKQQRIQEYSDLLRKRDVKIDRAVLESLDYEASGVDLAALREDSRVLAEVRGAEPVTVGDLTRAVERKFYHGVEEAVERKRVNSDLPAILDRLTVERAAMAEAGRLGIEKREDFQRALTEREDGLLFQYFLAKVISPSVRLEDDEVKAYYEEHKVDFTSPAMVRLESIAFGSRDAALAALDRLRNGADPAWLRENAEGLADPARYENMLRYGGRVVPVASLAEGVAGAVAGANKGEFRFYEVPGGPFYVLWVRDVFPAAPRPFADVKRDAAQRLFLEKRQEALDAFAKEARAGSEVEVFATGDALGRILTASAPQDPGS